MCSYVGTHGNSGPYAALRARSFEFATYQFPKFWPDFRKAIQEFVRPETRAGVDSAHVVIGIVASHDYHRKYLNDRERDGSVAGKQTWVGRGWGVGGIWTGRGWDSARSWIWSGIEGAHCKSNDKVGAVPVRQQAPSVLDGLSHAHLDTSRSKFAY